MPALAPRLVALALLATPGLARGDFFSSSPGPLAEGHRQLEGKESCTKCHGEGRKVDDQKCLACHEPIARRLAQEKGLHASSRVAGRACYLCHTDHKGRERDLLGFATVVGGGGAAARQRFDHDLTGWPLVQGHRGLTCEQCHRGRSFLKAEGRCESCHRNPHGELRPALRRCERCHDAASFQPRGRSEFDHDSVADARFALEGKHLEVPCAKCHPQGIFRRPGGFAAPDCTPCHDNVHGDGVMGKKRCQLCHAAKVPWRTVKLDHGRHTRFALDGAHSNRPCAACHGPGGQRRPERTCGSCHRDPHRGRFAESPDCAACHTSQSFRGESRFDPGARTAFPLAGKHLAIDCRRCHRGGSPGEWERFDAATVGCLGCHQHKNVHKRQFPDEECLRCHKAGGGIKLKKAAIRELHGPLSRFPLEEGHAGVPCEGCHKNDAYQGTPTVCGPACHADELHRGSLGKDCLACHQGGRWTASRFDHDQTSYPLVGHHELAPCDGCHRGRRFKPTPRGCAACHGASDAHGGTLGHRCERCHSPTGKSLFDHNDAKAADRFRLDGRHGALRCRACHDSTRFKTGRSACVDCHPEPARHAGELGTRCGDCHDAGAWKTIRTGHLAGGARFAGAHDRLPCATCHRGGASRRGTGELCVDCHQGDDVHHLALGPRCGDCHGQESFAPARFQHTSVGCDLRGLHRALPCNDCHTGGHFAAVAPTCVACHRGDAIRARSSPRAPPGHESFTTCGGCHNVNFFVPARPSGDESVCR